MNCQNCSQIVEEGAAFCGNCGQALGVVNNSVIAQAVNNEVSTTPTAPGSFTPAAIGGVATGVPSYALATPRQHAGETKALLALLFGIMGIVAALFIALGGIAFGIAGIIMGTLSRHSTKRGLSTAGLILSTLAILAGLGVWAYVAKHDPRLNQQAIEEARNAAPVAAAADLSTPCYSVGFVNILNIKNSPDSCDMSAFNGQTLESSSTAFKVYANKAVIPDVSTFATSAKQAIETDVQNSLPGFTIDSEGISEFAGSPAYVVKVSDKAHDVTLIEAAVLHETANGQNVFILVHAQSGDKVADLQTFEAQWQWK